MKKDGHMLLIWVSLTVLRQQMHFGRSEQEADVNCSRKININCVC